MAPRKTSVPVSFETDAKWLIRKALWSQGKTYRELAQLLTDRGLPFTRDNLANKIGRGRFSAAFLLLCLDVLNQRLD